MKITENSLFIVQRWVQLHLLSVRNINSKIFTGKIFHALLTFVNIHTVCMNNITEKSQTSKHTTLHRREKFM